MVKIKVALIFYLFFEKSVNDIFILEEGD